MSIHELGNYQSLGGEFAEMRAWILSKLMWNPNLDTKALVSEFIRDYYGEAAPYIQQYFNLSHSIIKDDTMLDIYCDETNPLYTNEFIAEANAILNQAKQAVASSDEEIRFRVDLVGLQIDYMRLLRSPLEAQQDGTYDRFHSFVYEHNIKVNEFTSNDEFFMIYNKLINGEIKIEDVVKFITQRWIENAG